MSLRKTLAVGRKEFRQIARDRRSLLVLLFVPAFFLLLYGYALNFDVQHVALAVEDNDRGPEVAHADLVDVDLPVVGLVLHVDHTHRSLFGPP